MKTLLFSGSVLVLPRPALACAVCFGQSDAPMAQAMNMGIFLMLGVVAVILAGFAGFFIYLNRRARLFEDASSTAVDRPAQAIPHLGSEGTA